MYRLIVLLAALLFCGCGRQGDSKPAQASSTPSVATTILATASNSLVKNEALSDEEQIAVVASEYMLRNKFADLTNGTVFVSLTNTEMQALAAKLPGCRFRSIDKMIAGREDDRNLLRDSETRDTGFGLIVNGRLTSTNEATVMVAGRFTGSATIYECHMYRRPTEWVVLYISGPAIADGPWGRPPRK